MKHDAIQLITLTDVGSADHQYNNWLGTSRWRGTEEGQPISAFSEDLLFAQPSIHYHDVDSVGWVKEKTVSAMKVMLTGKVTQDHMACWWDIWLKHIHTHCALFQPTRLLCLLISWQLAAQPSSSDGLIQGGFSCLWWTNSHTPALQCQHDRVWQTKHRTVIAAT